MAGGLTARQFGQLLTEHGSYAAAIEARPDLADQLRAAQRLADQAVSLAEKLGQGAESFRAVTEHREPEALEPLQGLELSLLREIADTLDRQMGATKRGPRSGRPPVELPLEAVEAAEKLLGERKRLTDSGKAVPPRSPMRR